jgi:EmrB/QacA subfamily drug resistance transporter
MSKGSDQAPVLTDRRTLATAGVSLGVFLAALDITIVGTAMPSVVAQLGGFGILGWAFTSYNIATLSSSPLFGKMADMYGVRRIFLISVVIFMVASALCGTAGSMLALIVYRGLQGFGAGALMAVGLTAMGLIYPPEELALMHGVLNTVWGGAAVLGPILGGLLVTHASWRWIFYINLPTGVVASALILAALKVEGKPRAHRLDLMGAVSLVGCLACLLLAFGGERAGNAVWTPKVFSLIGASLVFLGVFLWAEKRATEPILPLELFRDRTITVCYIMGAVAGAALLGTTAFIPLFVQGSWGTSALQAGATLIPISIAWAVSSFFGMKYCRRWFKDSQLLGAGGFLMAVSNALLSRLGGDSGWFEVMGCMVLLGLGQGLTVSLIVSTVQRATPRRHIGSATAGAQLFRHLGGTIVVGVLSGVMATQVAVRLRDIPLGPVGAVTARDLLRTEVVARIPTEALPLVQDAFAHGVATVFFVNFCVLLLNLVLPFALPAPELVAPITRQHRTGAPRSAP